MKRWQWLADVGASILFLIAIWALFILALVQW